jgi:hypothetical protein
MSDTENFESDLNKEIGFEGDFDASSLDMDSCYLAGDDASDTSNSVVGSMSCYANNSDDSDS